MNYGGLEELVKDCVNYLPTPHKSQVRCPFRFISYKVFRYGCQDIDKQLESEKKASGQSELPGTAPALPGAGPTDDVPEHILTSSLEDGLDISMT